MPKGIVLTAEQQEERRKEIVSIALRLIDENGLQKTSMREIAQMANMGKSSLYDFFKTKDEIIVYAIEEEIKVVSQEVKRITNSARNNPCSPEQQIKEMIHN